MAFFILILLILSIAGAKFSGFGKFNMDYMEKKNTTAVNGIFVMLVLLSHYSQYADFGSVYDIPYLALKEHLKQMVVATFMFYSGYGMMEAIRHRGREYVKKILSKAWQLLVRFDIAVLLFVAVNRILGIQYPADQLLLAFTTWTAVGNSNWYITAILILYFIMFLSFSAGQAVSADRRGRVIGIVLTALMTCAAVWLQIRIGRPSYCYNTMMLLPLGCMYSEFRPQIEKRVMHSDISYLITLIITAELYVLFFLHQASWGITGYTLWGITFISLILLITMKLCVYNVVLEWTGKHIFSIYILQRLPMIVLDHFGIIADHKYLSLILVIAITFIIAELFQKCTDRLLEAMTGKHMKESANDENKEKA